MSIHRFSEFINEAKKNKAELTVFQDFAEKRQMGAQKIADTAKKKGGLAMLTYNHFIVKIPYYTKAASGKLTYEAIVKEYDQQVNDLAKGDFNQTQFQRLVGIIEVLGELKLEYEKRNPKEVNEARLRPEELEMLRTTGLLDPDLFDPEEKDIQRAIALQNKSWSKRDGAAESMAKLITDHQKLVRRAKAIAKHAPTYFDPFERQLRRAGYSAEQISRVKNWNRD
jgi:hypothetical protein